MSELNFVRFADRHVSSRVDWLNNVAVLAGVPMHGSVTLESTAEWARRVATDNSRADFVLENEGGRPVVMCGITHMDEASARGELYMFAAPEVHGRGYGSAALEHLCHWAFLERDLNRIFLFTLGNNEAARRFYERGGFVQEGCLRQHQLHDGSLVDRYVHGLLAAEWASDVRRGMARG